MFSGSNLVANGVLIEAKSVEDNGGGILFNVYCYNVQPGVGINYENGDSWLEGTTPQQSAQTDTPQNEGSQSSAGSGAGESGSSGSTTGSASSGSDSSATENSAANPAQTAIRWPPISLPPITALAQNLRRPQAVGTFYEVPQGNASLSKIHRLVPCGACNPPQ